MKVCADSLRRPSIACGIAVLCAAVFATSAHMAQAGINVWTSHGPGSAPVNALVLDHFTQTLYAGTDDGRGEC